MRIIIKIPFIKPRWDWRYGLMLEWFKWGKSISIVQAIGIPQTFHLHLKFTLPFLFKNDEFTAPKYLLKIEPKEVKR